MGNSFSSRAEIERRDDPETVFVVPGHMNLTLAQMDIILRAGQQPGVPFRLGAAGAQRPQGNKVKVNYAENLVSVQKGTLRLTECESSRDSDSGNLIYSVSFNYDSLVPAVVRIFVGASDRTVPHQIRIENATLILGPYKLEAGSNRSWSSSSEQSFIDDKSLMDRHRQTGALPPDIFDLVLCVAPAEMVTRCDLFSIPPGIQSRHQSQTQKDNMAWLTQQQQADQRKSQAVSQMPPDTERSVSTISVCSLSSAVVPSKVQVQVNPRTSADDVHKIDPNTPIGEYDFDTEKTLVAKLRKKPATPELLPPGGADQNSSPYTTPLTHQRSLSKCVPIHTSEVFLAHDYGKLAMVICEVSYVRLVAPKDNDSVRTTVSVQNPDAITNQYNAMSPQSQTQARGAGSAVQPAASSAPEQSKARTVKCVMQRVQMSNGVFLTQDIYGMDRNCVEEPETEPATDDTPKAVGDSAPAQPAQTPAGITLDSDAIECVICLTDPRIIAVYPCRHMCLCASCAEVLPSQGNKCPICRRAASMLLKICPKDSVEESSI